jgi:hypothetical protein
MAPKLKLATAGGYETFTGSPDGRGRRSLSPRVSIDPTGRIMMNKAVMALLTDNRVEHVTLLWDRKEKRIAFKPSDGSEPHARKLIFYRNTCGFSAKAFLVAFVGLDLNRAVAFDAEWSDGMLSFSILEASNVRA